MATWRGTHSLSASLPQSRGVRDRELYPPALAINLRPQAGLARQPQPWHLTRWPRNSSKTNPEASHANSVELWSIVLAVPAQAPAIAARAAVCAASAKDTKFSTIIQILCRSTGTEMARGAFEDNDKDALSATPSR